MERIFLRGIQNIYRGCFLESSSLSSSKKESWIYFFLNLCNPKFSWKKYVYFSINSGLMLFLNLDCQPAPIYAHTLDCHLCSFLLYFSFKRDWSSSYVHGLCVLIFTFLFYFLKTRKMTDRENLAVEKWRLCSWWSVSGGVRPPKSTSKINCRDTPYADGRPLSLRIISFICSWWSLNSPKTFDWLLNISLILCRKILHRWFAA